MRYPTVGYVATEDDSRLELECYDGTRRGVVFCDAAAALEAIQPGRAELDCVAVQNGFLPMGAEVVHEPTVIRRAFEDDPGSLRDAIALAAASGRITPETDRVARRARPADSNRYDATVRKMKAARPAPTLH